MSRPLLNARGLTCVVAGQRLFDGLDLAILPGDLIEVRGPNGCGKSTLLRCLAGLYHPEDGDVERGAPFVYLGHRAGLSADMTPLENLRWFAAIDAVRVEPALLAGAMDRVGLGGARFDRCGMLSAGQQRRAALARLLVCRASVWLLDEPLTALDDAGCALMRGFIDEHRARGGAAVCATHRSLALPISAHAEGRNGRLPQTRVVALGS